MKITTQNNKLFINGVQSPFNKFEVYLNENENKWSYRIDCTVDQLNHYIQLFAPKALFGDLLNETGIIWFMTGNDYTVTVTCYTRDLEEMKLLKVISDDFKNTNWVSV